MNRIIKLVEAEGRFFETSDILEAFKGTSVKPYSVTREWGYGPEIHECWVVAESPAAREQIVYCQTGFGPCFPWGHLLKEDSYLGPDAIWHAYLYEAFVSSDLWGNEIPKGFWLMGPGERGNP